MSEKSQRVKIFLKSVWVDIRKEVKWVLIATGVTIGIIAPFFAIAIYLPSYLIASTIEQSFSPSKESIRTGFNWYFGTIIAGGAIFAFGYYLRNKWKEINKSSTL